jgi:alpha-ketoglutarate-dependent taurine dioxygenase
VVEPADPGLVVRSTWWARLVVEPAEALAEAVSRPPLTTAHPSVNTCSARVLALEATKGMAAHSWHTDVTFVDRIPAFSILRGRLDELIS